MLFSIVPLSLQLQINLLQLVNLISTAMYSALAFLMTASLFSIFSMANVHGQTIAIGHVTAEVVESISASSMAVTGFDLNRESSRTALANNGAGGWNFENVNLGEIKINSGRGIACNVLLKSATLSDSYGNGFTIEPVASGSITSDPQRTEGNQTLHLEGIARMSKGQAAGKYQGSYTMVFAYN